MTAKGKRCTAQALCGPQHHGFVATDLHRVLTSTQRVQIFAVGAYPGAQVKRRIRAQYVLADVTDADGSRVFRNAAACSESSRKFLWMCMGDLFIELWGRDRDLLGVARLVDGRELRWDVPELGPLLLAGRRPPHRMARRMGSRRRSHSAKQVDLLDRFGPRQEQQSEGPTT